MAGLEGIDANSMDVIDALGATRYVYDEEARIAKPLIRHADRVPVAVNREGERVVDRVRFGMPGFKGRLITNARDDKLQSAATWKALLGKPEHHSLTAISYVVERDKKTDTTYRVQRRDGGLMVVPGLTAVRHFKFASTGNEYDDACHVQVTCDANDFVATIHDRFVVDLDSPAARDTWMSADVDAGLDLLRPAGDEVYEMVPIAADAWKSRSPEAVAPAGEPRVWQGD